MPVGVVTELVEGDIYHWGSLMAGALVGSLPVVILYSFFVEYYVSGHDRRGEGIGRSGVGALKTLILRSRFILSLRLEGRGKSRTLSGEQAA